MSRSDDIWHLDKRMSIAIIFAIVIQTAAIVYWAGVISERVSDNEQHIKQTNNTGERIAAVETELKNGYATIERILNTLERLMTSGEDDQ